MLQPDPLLKLARDSGAFAMLALDQRESLRAMLAGRGDADVPDSALSGFKVDAARALNGARLDEEGLDQARLTGTGMADQHDVPHLAGRRCPARGSS